MGFMTKNIECTGRIMGLGKDELRESNFTKVIRVNEAGWELECNPTLVENLIKMHGLDGPEAKGCATPWDPSFDKMKDRDEELNDEDASTNKTGAGIGQYICSERYDITYPTKEVRRKTSKPTKRSQA